MEGEDADTIAARQRFLAKKGGGRSRTGGKGSVRRKKVNKGSAANSDDKKLSATLKRLGVAPIPGIEEINLFKDNGEVIHFKTPKVQANINANTYVVSGNGEQKRVEQLLPGIISQLGPDSLNSLKQIVDSMQQNQPGMMGGGQGLNPFGTNNDLDDDEDDDEVPDLVGDFEKTSEQD